MSKATPSSRAAADRPGATAAPAEAASRVGAMRAIDRLLLPALAPAARKRGFVEAALLAEWAGVVGPALAGRCQPVRIDLPRGGWRGGLLHLAARSAAALELQHAAPQIIERINSYFGFQAVRRLKLVQMPLPMRPQPPPAAPVRPLSAAEEQALDGQLAGLSGSEPLRAALLSLGRAVRRGR